MAISIESDRAANPTLVGDKDAARLPYLTRGGGRCLTHGTNIFDDYRIDQEHLGKTPKLHAALRTCRASAGRRLAHALLGLTREDLESRSLAKLVRWTTARDMAQAGFWLPPRVFRRMAVLPVCARPGLVSGLLVIGQRGATRILQEPGSRRPTGLAGWHCLPSYGQWTVETDALKWLRSQANRNRRGIRPEPVALLVGGEYDGLWERFSEDDLARFTPTSAGVALRLASWPRRDGPPSRSLLTYRKLLKIQAIMNAEGECDDLLKSHIENDLARLKPGKIRPGPRPRRGGPPQLRDAMADPAFPLNIQADLLANGVPLCDALNYGPRSAEYEFMAGQRRIAQWRDGWFVACENAPGGWKRVSNFTIRPIARIAQSPKRVFGQVVAKGRVWQFAGFPNWCADPVRFAADLAREARGARQGGFQPVVDDPAAYRAILQAVGVPLGTMQATLPRGWKNLVKKSLLAKGDLASRVLRKLGKQPQPAKALAAARAQDAAARLAKPARSLGAMDAIQAQNPDLEELQELYRSHGISPGDVR